MVETSSWSDYLSPLKYQSRKEGDMDSHEFAYRKILNISPGLIEFRKHFSGGLYLGGAYIRGAYILRAFCVSVRVSRPQNSLLYIANKGKKVFL